MKSLVLLCALTVAAAQTWNGDLTSCLTQGPAGCLQTKLDGMLNKAQLIPELRLTRELSIVKINNQGSNEVDNDEENFLTRLESYLYSHGLRLKLPKELESVISSSPEQAPEAVPREIVLPLAEDDQNQGRGMMKKVILPFLLGLKFKATAVIPLAMALIALKTWKALTLGLLSIVLSGAMIIFKLTKPKLSAYEVYYPHPPHHHHHHVVDHPPPAHYDHHYARSLRLAAQSLDQSS